MNELGIEPELIAKLQEFCNSEDREQLIQQISQQDLIQLQQLAEQLQRTHPQPDQIMDDSQEKEENE